MGAELSTSLSDRTGTGEEPIQPQCSLSELCSLSKCDTTLLYDENTALPDCWGQILTEGVKVLKALVLQLLICFPCRVSLQARECNLEFPPSLQFLNSAKLAKPSTTHIQA